MTPERWSHLARLARAAAEAASMHHTVRALQQLEPELNEHGDAECKTLLSLALTMYLAMTGPELAAIAAGLAGLLEARALRAQLAEAKGEVARLTGHVVELDELLAGVGQSERSKLCRRVVDVALGRDVARVA